MFGCPSKEGQNFETHHVVPISGRKQKKKKKNRSKAVQTRLQTGWPRLGLPLFPFRTRELTSTAGGQDPAPVASGSSNLSKYSSDAQWPWEKQGVLFGLLECKGEPFPKKMKNGRHWAKNWDSWLSGSLILTHTRLYPRWICPPGLGLQLSPAPGVRLKLPSLLARRTAAGCLANSIGKHLTSTGLVILPWSKLPQWCVKGKQPYFLTLITPRYPQNIDPRSNRNSWSHGIQSVCW